MALRELRSKLTGRGLELKAGFAAGGDAAAALTLTGIKVGDKVAAAFEIQPPGAGSGDTIKTNLTSTITISDVDEIKSSAATNSNQVLVFWWTRQ